ncbi:hypothetical protein ACJMK2_033962 [Sinanodonta woodiana]|uniref:poly(A)-specific ribonuclease n=1 Tax=Sinanodonta woodiana TaxID=1069815 RepID=A0ABD3WQ30_SINWO
MSIVPQLGMGAVMPVKREVVSVNLESLPDKIPSYYSKPAVVGHRGFEPPCRQCQAERKKTPKPRQKAHRRPQVRANTPIIISLRDTLKAALRQKLLQAEHSQREKDSDSKDDLDMDTDCSSERGDKIEVRKVKKRKDTKNFHALLNVMEKAHQKKSVGMENNLSREERSNDKLVAEFVLNNASMSTKHNSKDCCKKRSINECSNVDLICNDLNSNESGWDDIESEISSTASSSEIHSDTDSTSNAHSDTPTQEFTTEELQRLEEFTTGYPLIRYDCPPSECPQCQWLNAQYYNDVFNVSSTHSQNTQYSNDHHSKVNSSAHMPKTSSSEIDTDDVETSAYESDSGEGLDESSNPIPTDSGDHGLKVKTEEENSAPFPGVIQQSFRSSGRNRFQKQLLDIDIAGRPNRSNSNHLRNSVYIDLTDTDVTFTVYYHHTRSSSTNYARFSKSAISSHHHGYSDYHISEGAADISSENTHCTLPPKVSPYYQYMYYHPTLYSYPAPYCMPLDSDSSLPKTAMIPPNELRKFNVSQPPQRHWIPLTRPEQNRPAAIFTVMCYNVLCDKYCTRQMYGYCPTWALNWDYRKKGIIEEIHSCAADIICLQEVETDQFYNFFMPDLEREGYEGIFSPKSRARTMTEHDRKHVDGCAIFYKTAKFRLLKEHLIEFNQLAMANAEGSDDMLNRVMTKDNIGLAALLETKEGVFESGGGMPPEAYVKQPLLVATAHVHWDPEYSDVKLIQTMMLMWELKRITEDSASSFRPGSTKPESSAIPMILCGDLNSLPESGVIEYLTSGKVAANHEDFKEIGYEACLQKINLNKDEDNFSHSFKLARAYSSDIMPYTNFTYDFKGIIDYIFYSRDFMNLLGLLGPLDPEWFSQNKIYGCPHPHVPSDHFSLFVEFEMPVPLHNLGNPSGNRGGNQREATGGSFNKMR